MVMRFWCPIHHNPLVRGPNPFAATKNSTPIYRGLIFGIVANFIDVFYFVSIHNKNERSFLCQKYVKVVRCR